jgi:hypothetical protein
MIKKLYKTINDKMHWWFVKYKVTMIKNDKLTMEHFKNQHKFWQNWFFTKKLKIYQK